MESLLKSFKKSKVCSCWFLMIIRIISVVLLTVVLINLVKRYKSSNKNAVNEYFYEENIEPIKYLYQVLTQEEFKTSVETAVFFSTLSQYDLFARSSNDNILKSTEHYQKVYSSSYEDMTDDEKIKLNKAVDKANQLLTKYRNLQLLDWKFVKINSSIENGLPHTLGDFIVLNMNVLDQNERDLVKTIIHEKIHIYQRMNTSSINKWINSVGFETVLPNEKMSIGEYLFDLRRSNPDLNTNTYYHKKSNLILKQLYTNTSPTSLNDSKAYGIPKGTGKKPVILTNELLGLPPTVYCQLEHPYEIMACVMAEIIVNPLYAEEYVNNVFIDETVKWMRDELKM